MAEHKHWSEYLLPVPTTVSLVSMLMLISAQFSTEIQLKKPSSGEWEYLKWDTLVPNIENLKNSMIEAFEISDTSMLRINYNSREINGELEKIVKYSAYPQDTQNRLKTKKLLLKASMKLIENMAKENIAKVKHRDKKNH